MLAPIGLSTYKRQSHVKRTIEALQRNRFAAESELYVFSDGPKSGDEETIHELRKYLRSISGFKKVEITERKVNYGLDGNNKDGIQSILDSYDRLIWLEEDCVTAPSFLQFVNHALDVYEHNRRIFSISGYSPPIKIPDDYAFDVFLLPRFGGWGLGIWKGRYELVERVLPKEEVSALFNSWQEQCNFGVGGLDLLNMLKKEVKTPHAHDVRMFFRQYQLRMDTIYPVGSLVRNIGFDGSGTNTRRTKHKNVNLMTKEKSWNLPPELERDKRILRNNFFFRISEWYRRPKLILPFISFAVYRLLHRESIIP
jgi:hypothetical protein